MATDPGSVLGLVQPFMTHRTDFPLPADPRPASNLRLCLLFAACLGVSACGSDDDDANTPVGPSGPVELSIEGFLNDRGESFERDAGEVVLSCDGTINVRFGPRQGATLKNWVLRPPGACESMKQCGYIVLTVTPSAGGKPNVVAGASTTLLSTASPGAARLDASLRTGDGEPFLQNQVPVEDTLSGVEFVAPSGCDPTTTTSSGGTGSGGSGTASGGASSVSSTTGSGGAAGAAGQAGGGGAAGDVQG